MQEEIFNLVNENMNKYLDYLRLKWFFSTEEALLDSIERGNYSILDILDDEVRRDITNVHC